MLRNDKKIKGTPNGDSRFPSPSATLLVDEGMINVRYALESIVKQRKVIVGLGLVFGVLALILSLLAPETYTTEAGVTLLSIRSEVIFDPEFTTTPIELPTNQVDKRGQALRALAENPSLLGEVYTQIRPTLNENSRTSLDTAVTAVVEGDFLRLQVTWDNAEDATMIANEWARYYVDTANRAYVSTSSNTPDEAREAALEAFVQYQATQEAYEAFIATNKLDQVQSEIEELDALITKMRELKTHALVLLNTNSIESNTQLANATSTTLRTEIEQSVSRDVMAQQLELQNWYRRNRTLKELKNSLEDVRAGAENGTLDAAASGDFLAVMLARAGLLEPVAQEETTSPAGTQLQLQVNVEELMGSGAALTVEEIDALLATVNKGIETSEEQIALLGEALFLGTALNAPTSIPEDHTIFTLVEEQVDHILSTSMVLASDSPDLEQKPLQQDLIQLSERRQELQSEKEAIEARTRELVRNRDSSWDLYTTLDNKAREAEAQFATGAPQVRLAVPAIQPTEATASSPLIVTLVAVLVGVSLGLIYTLILEILSSLSLGTHSVLGSREPHPTGD